MKYLSFMLADQFCGIELSCVRELLGYMDFTPRPGGHPAMLGVLDLRGKKLRVVDLRVRFGLRSVRTDETVMIIVDLAGETISLITDNTVGIERAAQNGAMTMQKQSRIEPRFIQGCMTVGDRTLVLLNLVQSLIIDPPLPKAA